MIICPIKNNNQKIPNTLKVFLANNRLLKVIILMLNPKVWLHSRLEDLFVKNKIIDYKTKTNKLYWVKKADKFDPINFSYTFLFFRLKLDLNLFYKFLQFSIIYRMKNKKLKLKILKTNKVSFLFIAFRLMHFWKFLKTFI